MALTIRSLRAQLADRMRTDFDHREEPRGGRRLPPLARRNTMWRVLVCVFAFGALAAGAVWIAGDNRAQRVSASRVAVLMGTSDPEREQALQFLLQAKEDIEPLLRDIVLSPDQPDWAKTWAARMAAKLPPERAASIVRAWLELGPSEDEFLEVGSLCRHAGEPAHHAMADAILGLYGEELRLLASRNLPSGRGKVFPAVAEKLAPLLDDPDTRFLSGVLPYLLALDGAWAERARETIDRALRFGDARAAKHALQGASAVIREFDPQSISRHFLAPSMELALTHRNASVRRVALQTLAPRGITSFAPASLKKALRRVAFSDPSARARRDASILLVSAGWASKERVEAMAHARNFLDGQALDEARQQMLSRSGPHKSQLLPSLMAELRERDPAMAIEFAEVEFAKAPPTGRARRNFALAMAIALRGEPVAWWNELPPSLPPLRDASLEELLFELTMSGGEESRCAALLLPAIIGEDDAAMAPRLAAALIASTNGYDCAGLGEALEKIGAGAVGELPALRAAIAGGKRPIGWGSIERAIRNIEGLPAPAEPAPALP